MVKTTEREGRAGGEEEEGEVVCVSFHSVTHSWLRAIMLQVGNGCIRCARFYYPRQGARYSEADT